MLNYNRDDTGTGQKSWIPEAFVSTETYPHNVHACVTILEEAVYFKILASVLFLAKKSSSSYHLRFYGHIR